MFLLWVSKDYTPNCNIERDAVCVRSKFHTNGCNLSRQTSYVKNIFSLSKPASGYRAIIHNDICTEGPMPDFIHSLNICFTPYKSRLLNTFNFCIRPALFFHQANSIKCMVEKDFSHSNRLSGI